MSRTTSTVCMGYVGMNLILFPTAPKDMKKIAFDPNATRFCSRIGMGCKSRNHVFFLVRSDVMEAIAFTPDRARLSWPVTDEGSNYHPFSSVCTNVMEVSPLDPKRTLSLRHLDRSPKIDANRNDQTPLELSYLVSQITRDVLLTARLATVNAISVATLPT